MTDLLIPEVETPDPAELRAYLLDVYEREVAPLPKPRAVGACSRYTDRDGKVSCWHSKDDYDWWIVASGAGFRLKCIQGSWTTAVSGSANTHGGGGAKDVNGNGYTQTEVIRQCRLARDRGLLAWPRFWVNSDGSKNWHAHVLDPMCPNMSAEAQAQVVEFGKGGDGLVGTNPDPLGGYQKDLIMALWGKRFSTVLTPPPAIQPTSITVLVRPTTNVLLGLTELRAIVKPAVAGSYSWAYSNDAGKTALPFTPGGPQQVNKAGELITNHRFGGSHVVRATFTPTDKTKYASSKSAWVPVKSIDLGKLADRVSAIEQAPANPQ